MTTPDSKRPKSSLVETAEAAIAKYPDSDVEIALEFLKEVLPSFCKESNDRLVKMGRSLKSLISLKESVPLQSCIENLVEECQILTQTDIKVPKVRFGKTELQMPIVSLGCMRFQQQWGDKITNMNMVGSDCQGMSRVTSSFVRHLCDIWSHSLSLLATGIIIDNLVAILKHAILDFGINHIEAARGYGSSELQLGVALKQLYASTDIKREDLIIQSKVPSDKNVDEFRRRMELTFRNLQVDYLDLFAFHGFNGEWQWEWMFGGEDNCWNVIQEYKAAGKIRHVGFSTHGPNELISRAIETDKFDYVNLHHHFCGSYTASGDGPNGTGNLKCLRLMKERDMGGKCVHFNCRRNVASLVLCCND
jgi:diketogulonate reductase-like aldo/keto reductase